MLGGDRKRARPPVGHGEKAGRACEIVDRILALERDDGQRCRAGGLEDHAEQHRAPVHRPAVARSQRVDLFRGEVTVGRGKIEVEVDCCRHEFSETPGAADSGGCRLRMLPQAIAAVVTIAPRSVEPGAPVDADLRASTGVDRHSMRLAGQRAWGRGGHCAGGRRAVSTGIRGMVGRRAQAACVSSSPGGAPLFIMCLVSVPMLPWPFMRDAARLKVPGRFRRGAWPGPTVRALNAAARVARHGTTAAFRETVARLSGTGTGWTVPLPARHAFAPAVPSRPARRCSQCQPQQRGEARPRAARQAADGGSCVWGRGSDSSCSNRQVVSKRNAAPDRALHDPGRSRRRDEYGMGSARRPTPPDHGPCRYNRHGRASAGQATGGAK